MRDESLDTYYEVQGEVLTQACLSMMDMDQTFHQRWDFRRKDDEVDSLSDDSKSSSGDEPVGKKLKLVPSSPEKDEANDSQISQQKIEIAKDKKQNEPGKKRNATNKKSEGNRGEKRKRKMKMKVNHPTLDQEPPPLLGDFKIFTDSLLEELKVARKKMFAQMRKQITKMVTAKPILKPKKRSGRAHNSDMPVHQTGKKSSRKTQTCNEGLAKGERRSNGQRKNNGKLKVAVDKGEARSLPAKKPLLLPNNSDQIGSSSYLTLPTVLPKPQTESLSRDSSLCDHIQCGISGTNTKNAEREDLLVDANNHCSYLLGIRPAEQFGNFDQIPSKRLSFLNQQSSQITSMLSVLPVPLHQWSNSGFNLTSQSVVENPAQENNSASMRMNDGNMGFAGRSHAPPECFVANTISSNTSYSSNGGGFVSFCSGDIKRGLL